MPSNVFEPCCVCSPRQSVLANSRAEEENLRDWLFSLLLIFIARSVVLGLRACAACVLLSDIAVHH